MAFEGQEDPVSYAWRERRKDGKMNRTGTWYGDRRRVRAEERRTRRPVARTTLPQQDDSDSDEDDRGPVAWITLPHRDESDSDESSYYASENDEDVERRFESSSESEEDDWLGSLLEHALEERRVDIGQLSEQAQWDLCQDIARRLGTRTKSNSEGTSRAGAPTVENGNRIGRKLGQGKAARRENVEIPKPDASTPKTESGDDQQLERLNASTQGTTAKDVNVVEKANMMMLERTNVAPKEMKLGLTLSQPEGRMTVAAIQSERTAKSEESIGPSPKEQSVARVTSTDPQLKEKGKEDLLGLKKDEKRDVFLKDGSTEFTESVGGAPTELQKGADAAKDVGVDSDQQDQCWTKGDKGQCRSEVLGRSSWKDPVGRYSAKCGVKETVVRTTLSKEPTRPVLVERRATVSERTAFERRTWDPGIPNSE